ncbi:MAG: T9SS type A sorting domain-containing protein [Bacteroidales bacterium]
MKNNHLLIAFAIILGTILYEDLPAQQYHPFPEEDAFWTVAEFNQNLGIWDTYIYTINGDTTINGLVYEKVYQLNDTLEGQDTVWKFHACMRQEIDNKKVFFIRNYLGETTEKLGCDFNVNLDDTISLPAFAYLEYDTLFRRVVTDDSVLLWNGEYRKHYLFGSISDPGYDLSVIEGIGESRSAFPNLIYWDSFHQSEVTCFRLYGEYLYGAAPEPTDCDFTLKINELSSDDKVICSPIPVDRFLTINLPKTNSKVYDVVLFNTLGISLDIKHMVSNESPFLLDVSEIPPGCYLLYIKSDNHIFFNKIIINH